VVAFPKPLTIVEPREIKKLIEMDFVFFPCGGGGIPLIRKKRKLRGVEAEIDKGLASAELSEEINTDMLIVPSGVKGAAIPTRLVFDVIGMDIVEVSPPYDHAEITALVAETLGLDLLYVLAANRKEN